MKPLVLTAVMAAAYVSAAGQAKPSIEPDVINVAGGTFKKGYYSLDFSIGEATLINTMKSPGNNFFLTNGFFQPYIFGLNVPPRILISRRTKCVSIPTQLSVRLS